MYFTLSLGSAVVPATAATHTFVACTLTSTHRLTNLMFNIFIESSLSPSILTGVASLFVAS